MPKIDCSKTENFLRELSRAISNCTGHCLDCAVYEFKKKRSGNTCISVLAQYPQETISLIQSWSDAHPIKTRLDDLKEKYPKFYTNEAGYPNVYPRVFGYCDNCSYCSLNSTLHYCWNEPLEGGATGE